VDGRAVKGPTDAFMEHSGYDRSAAGIASAYAGVIDGIVCDEPAAGLPVRALSTPTLMDGAEARRRLAEDTLGFVSRLGASAPSSDR
jgi:LPPG:FO 2-phospho-L-lactate transferase